MTQVARAIVEGPPAPGTYLHLMARPTPRAEILRLVEQRLREGQAGRMRFLRSRLRSREDAEDVLQEFALKTVQGAERLTDPAKVDAWLAVTLRNALFDRYRRNAGRARLQQAAQAEPAAPVEAETELEAPLACLSNTLTELKPGTGDLLRRAELEETPLRRLAGDLGITANNAGVRVHRAREALRQAMQARCAACATRCELAQRFLDRIA
ncbi:MAG: sigma-70 family RNA polymerase sigma factor [Phenylobacterium sp.]|uniref:sigma-70 family RNA polymerase sigma factor n=1 Tax=Phenylobacterium sp. TaxID=1871053 RepID=UPI002716E3F7|nr:sigma-70 family RNA polymerase sigma factor [Phenylobacterium sp.]MDO8324669.1 sigma-70 family RNA polymerase sigma factor [Phenylobacterium sp.]MDO9247455.1 sigma-70 family RNA polymerase sigma factor [Phenylobacterium sp.]MDP3635687.1 sigma-70 family RNA polymerase sigma factor [Phenylobacterium sp.]